MKKNICFKLLLLLMIVLSANLTFADWVKDGEEWKYEENGQFKTSDWLTIGPDTYYFDATSHMVKGLVKIGKNYYAFHNNGKAYTKKEHFEFNDVEYDIGSNGKVKELENDLTDEAYNKYITEKAIEDQNNKLFAAEQKAKRESEAKAMEEQRKATEAFAEAEKAKRAAERAAVAESQKAIDNYLLSAENDKKLVDAANRGTTSKQTVDNVAIELKAQLNYRKVELIAAAKAVRAANPAAEIYSFVEDYNNIIKRYAQRMDDILTAANYKYNINDEKMEKYVDQLSEILDDMKAKFNEELDKALG